jgi:hypothetical protein
MDNQRAQILSAMKSVADDISPRSPETATRAQGVNVDIGGINLRQVLSARTDGPRDERASAPIGPPPEERRRDCQRRSILRLLGIFLTFMAILPLYLVDILPDAIDSIALWIGFVSLVGGMVSFATISVYENS